MGSFSYASFPVQDVKETIGDSSAVATIYDFNDIDRYFSENQGENVVMEGQRVIPIYICKPLQYVQRKVVKQKMNAQEVAVLKELQKIDEMDIEVKKPTPKTKSDHSRKTRLVPLKYVESPYKRISTPKTKPPPRVKTPESEVKMEHKEEEIKPPSQPEVVQENPKESPLEEELKLPCTPPTTDPVPVPTAADQILTPLRRFSQDEEEPQFKCPECGQAFYMKRHLRRHLYSHK